jgi:hypothetical protein
MKRFLILLAIACVSTMALAQKADIGVTVGGSFVSDTQGAFLLPPPTNVTLQTDHHLFIEGTLAFRLLDAKVASLHVELPIAAIPSQKITFATAPSAVIDHLSSTFITPALRLKFVPASPIAPWVSFGGGWAHYSLDSGNSSSKAALQYGGGLDFKTGLPVLGFRAEVRDFVTGDPSLNVISLANTSGFHHHNILAGGGIILRF